MKKKIGISVILILEAILLLLDVVSLFVSEVLTTPVISTLANIGKWLFNLGKGLIKLVRLDSIITVEGFQSLIGVIIITLLFVGVYYLIFGIATVEIRKKQTLKRREIVPEYHLTNLEKEQLDESKFIRKKPIKTIISLIVPLTLIVFYTLIRFDNAIALENNVSGSLTISKDALEPFFNTLFSPIDFHIVFSNIVSIEVDLLRTLDWIEYVILVVAAALLLVIWFFLFYLLGLAFRKVSARRRSKYAKARHIEKMEKKEYKLHKKYKDETSVKADEFLSIVEEEQSTPATSISKINTFEEDDNQLSFTEKRKAYLEEIGYGVTDLGITESQEEVTKPITEREIRYISDEDVDIILEEEPVIEVVEEDDVTEDIVSDDDELFFEKYEVDENIFEDASGEGKAQDVEDLILIQTTKEVEEMVEEPQEEVVEEPIPQEEQTEEVVEEPLEESPKEEVLDEPKEEIVEEKVEEVPQEETPIEEDNATEEASIEEVQEQVEEEKVEEAKEETPTEEEVKEEPEIKEVEEIVIKPKEEKYDPFKKYRGQKIKDHGAKKVPSFKELGKDKAPEQVEAPVEPQVEVVDQPTEETKNDPFKAYRDKSMNKGHKAKKVPSFKELQAMKEKEEK